VTFVKKNRGFTLIELVVVVLILAVIAAIAVPTYLKQVRKARRNEVEAAVQQVALLEERYRAECTTYADFSTTCATASVTMPAWSTLYSGSYFNDATIGNISATGYKVTVVAKSTGGQDKDTASDGSLCKTLTYDYGVTTAGKVTKTLSGCW
jgi:type IV pilus assembly protein PilE